MRRLPRFLRIGLGFFAVVILVALLPRNVRVPLPGGGSVSFLQSSLVEKFRESICTIHIMSRETNEVELGQDFFGGPMMVIPSSNPNVFFCLYDWDVAVLLLRMDVSQKFQPIAPKSTLYSIVKRATCKVDRVLRDDPNDWDFVAAALDQMSSKQYKDESVGLNLLVYRLHTSQKFLADTMRSHNGYASFADDGPITLNYPPPYTTTNIPLTRRHKAQVSDTNSP